MEPGGHAHDAARPGLELLDPEPRRPTPRLSRESLIALLILVPLLLFGAWDWGQQSAQAAAYRAGTAAVAARHWEAARDAFAAAGNHRDAPARLQNATAQVTSLAEAYGRMAAAATAGDGLTAWQQAMRAAAIEPDYRDLAVRLPLLKEGLFHDGLAGLIFLQGSGTRPGLYLIQGDRTPALLPGSTRTSRVHNTSPDGRHFLYDGLGADGQPRLMYGSIGPGGVAVTGALPPLFDAQSAGWFSGATVWADATVEGAHVFGQFDLESGQAQSMLNPPPGTALLSVLPGGDRILFARNTRDDRGNAETTLTIASLDRGDLPSWRVPGFLETATVSPDGRYVAPLIEEVESGITRTLYLVDLEAPGTAAVPLERMAWQGIRLAARLRATFFTGTPSPGVVIERQDDSGMIMWRASLPGLQRTLLWAGHDVVQRDERSAISPDNRMFALRTQLDERAYLAWVPLAGGSPAATLRLHLLLNQNLDAAFAPHGQFLVGRVRNPDGLDRGPSDDLYTLPVDAGGDSEPQFLAHVSRTYDTRLPTVALSANGALAIYVAQGGDLHARTLDGTEDRVLGHGTDAVWALAPAP